MNEHNFDNDRKDNHTENSQNGENFDIYSKQYEPTHYGYTEQKRVYTYAQEPKAQTGTKRSRGRVLLSVLIPVALVIAFALSFSLASRLAFSYYEDHYGSIVDGEDPQAPIEGKPSLPSEESSGEDPSDDLIFSSDNDTAIEASDSSATVGGKIGDADLSMADVVALVADSVVEITTSETLRNGLVYESGAGSGVIVNGSGVIITNNHVLASGTDISVRLTNGNVYKATLVAADTETDIAIIKIDPKEKLTAATRGNSDNIVVGEEVLAIGNPLGILGGTVTNGIISALEREVTIEGETMTLLQHNAAISPGNSGGALFNMRGELIGIVNAKYLSSDAEGLGFAIPMNTVYKVYSDLIEFGYVKGRADHGLTITTDRYYVFQGYLYIYSSRYTDDLQYGDRLVSIDGKTPVGINDAYAMLSQYEIGDKVPISVVRDGKQITVSLEIREYTPQK